MRILVASGHAVFVAGVEDDTLTRASVPGGDGPTCLAADPKGTGRAWCGTADGVYRTEDGGRSWRASGLEGEHVMSLASGPVKPDLVWAGTEPSAVWRSGDGGATWERTRDFLDLPSSPSWAFPPRPETHHVRWIVCHPADPGRLWVAIEAGALISTPDGGRSWRDRQPEGPYDTHEAAIHPERPETLRIAAGDGYYESFDGGATWSSPQEGLEVAYLRSVAVDPGDPDVVVVSASSRPRTAYVAGRSDGRLYRREGMRSWRRVTEGWPEPPRTIAPLLASGLADGELWAADERGVHRSVDGGVTWSVAVPFEVEPSHLRGFALLSGESDTGDSGQALPDGVSGAEGRRGGPPR